ncbi:MULTISPECIES: helix-turn-helix transcriptional regulator [unclassified Saccharopolyspora]|uniref:helix-turn-helix domain-containing protein n=1 Tax=unclassified Saccharopolyspora TaxID=2646250 RepID=UPI001CD74B34|nr:MULTISPECIES: helix-turn-helix transcriptional regulator [unclassified Saccharopolyspora]MCA1193497.1 helix-turn-helix domain-containing protein [Saccharopolyspora sp. 6V]MCA1280508.1 helix-turn-helix domain-containing protein [Saccharopolyspora sp. 7B]
MTGFSGHVVVQDDVAAALQWSKAKVSRFENADQIPGPAEVLALAAIYGVNEAERDQYVALSLQHASAAGGRATATAWRTTSANTSDSMRKPITSTNSPST